MLMGNDRPAMRHQVWRRAYNMQMEARATRTLLYQTTV